MKYLLDALKMKAVDECSIKDCKIPSLVLMERAALGVSQHLLKMFKNDSFNAARVLCVCGNGNNGADGLAVARQLFEIGVDVSVFLTSRNNGTDEYELQKEIINNLGIPCFYSDSNLNWDEYNYIVDAIFGIGLSRKIEGEYESIIKRINMRKGVGSRVISVDIPSGVSATCGQVLGVAVTADDTVTFGYGKPGLLLYPGADCAGNVHIHNAGFAPEDILKKTIKDFDCMFTFDDEDIDMLPKRRSDSNKGTYGKALIVAGSKTIGGAAILCGRAAYSMGTGLVKLFTHKENKTAVLESVPECLLSTYENRIDFSVLNESVDWAGCIVAGPGLSMDDNAFALTKSILERKDKKRILDADALNIIAANKLDIMSENNVIVTPHIMEMSRLTGISVADIKRDIAGTAKTFAKENNCICVLKDARTVVSDGDRVYINTSGNDGMSTGGSGDVLAGILGGLIATGMDMFDAACLGVYIHGRAGDVAADTFGKRAMTAGNICDAVSQFLK